MVTLPTEFVAVASHPGYFWNKVNNTLYTAKLGTLRQLPICVPTKWSTRAVVGYRVSVNGRRRFLPVAALRSLQYNPSVFPVTHPTDTNQCQLTFPF